MRLHLLVLAGLVAAAVVSSPGCTIVEMARQSKATRNTDFTMPIPAMGQLEIRTVNGRVQCIAGDVSEIQVEAEITAYGRTVEEAEDAVDSITIDRTETDGVARIEADIPNGISASVSLLVILPAETKLNIRTTNGQVEVTGVTDDTIANTSNGEINLDECAGEITATSSNGKISIRGTSLSDVRAVTNNGSVRIHGHLNAGDHTVSTSNGSIHVDAFGPPVQVTADTTNGRIRANGKRVRRGRTTTLGSTGDASSDQIARLSLDTSNGSITIDHRSNKNDDRNEDDEDD